MIVSIMNAVFTTAFFLIWRIEDLIGILILMQRIFLEPLIKCFVIAVLNVC